MDITCKMCSIHFPFHTVQWLKALDTMDALNPEELGKEVRVEHVLVATVDHTVTVLAGCQELPVKQLENWKKIACFCKSSDTERGPQ